MDPEQREALRAAEARFRQLSAEIELLRAELNRKIDEAVDLMKRISSWPTSSHFGELRAGDEES
jgi:hypothetical protein